MFETHDSARRIAIFPLEGEYHWGYVNISLQHYWLYVTYVIDHGEDGEFTETIIFSQVSQLLEFANIINIKIIFIDLGSPGYMNGTERWKMEPLRAIWLCSSDKYLDQRVHIFQLESGVRYEGMLSAVSDAGFHADQLIFSISPVDSTTTY